jgi:phosphoheptose isomerase
MSYLAQNIKDAKAMMEQLHALEPQVNAAAVTIAKTLLSGGKLLACGNGGSAADASHRERCDAQRNHPRRLRVSS